MTDTTSNTGSAMPALAAGEFDTGSATATIPSDLPAGSYRLLACADDPGVVDESNEANNCRTSATTVEVSG